jgi:hypothetical protein
VFSDDALKQVSAEIAHPLQLLQERSPTTVKGGAEDAAEAICPVPQGEAIAQITQESPPTFLQKFGRAAKAELLAATLVAGCSPELTFCRFVVNVSKGAGFKKKAPVAGQYLKGT